MRKQKKANRHFIVGYIGTHTEHNTKITGQTSVNTMNGKFLDKKSLYEIILASSIIKDVVITFINEISESDHRDWLS